MMMLPSDALVIFGATGDLAYKKIFPALAALFCRNEIDMPVIGMARAGWTLEKLRQRVRDSLVNGRVLDANAFHRLSARLRYVDGDYRDPATFGRLKETLGHGARPLHYLAIPPSLFATVVRGLSRVGCAVNARVIVEKPFGRDLASARALNLTLHDVFDESAVFRIDHYLGKEAVQNLLYFRFANSFLEPIWNRNYVDNVQITLAEQIGVDGRGAFYDEVGSIRDVVQNHLLQVTTLLAMDAPAGRDAQSMRAEKLRVLRAMRPLDAARVVRGQFKGYRNEEGVAVVSQSETYSALCLNIDTWRWAGVPFYLRAGKRMPITATEVMVALKETPLAIFDDSPQEPTNYFRFRLSPEVVLSAGARVKRPGEDMRGDSVELIFRHAPHDGNLPYERLLRDAVRGDASLFTGDDCVEAAWAVVDPVLREPGIVHEYEPGTWGPPSPTSLMPGVRWHDPQPEASGPC